MMGRLGVWILERLREKTTWVGIFSLVGAVVGNSSLVSPELSNTLSTIGMTIAGAVLIKVPDR